jgi:AcrR family transcriptional regulator
MNKRESIIQATIDVVAKQGISDSPTSQIAKEAGAAELTLFRLFKNKKELLHQTYEEVSRRLQDKCKTEISNIEDVEEKLVALLKIAIKYYRKRHNELVYFQEYLYSFEGLPQRPDFRYEKGENISGYALVSILDEGKTKGVFKVLPMTALVGLTGAPIIMTLRAEQIRKKKYSKKEMDTLVQACSQAVKA